jgi:TPR repeat protein
MLLALLTLLLSAPTPIQVTADLNKTCAKGNAAACDELGNRYRFGIGTKRSDARAADMFKRSCKGKDPAGCADDALMLGLGFGERANPEAAIARLDKQCKEGLNRACGNMALLALHVNGADGKKAQDMMADSCRKGDLESCTNVSVLSWQSGNRDKALKYGRAACDNGHADGCEQLGILYLASEDRLRAAAAFAAGCELGSVSACTHHAISLLDAGVNAKKAIALLDQSCDLGEQGACDRAREARDHAENAARQKK